MKRGHKISMMVMLFLPLTIILTCCGGGGGGGAPAQNVPSIANLQYSPTAAYANSGSGEATVTGSIDFSDPNGNLAALTVTIFNSNGQQVSTITQPITGASGITNGTISISGTIDTTVIGLFTFKIYVTDATGHSSNSLTGTFRVSDVAWKTKASMSAEREGFAAVALNGQIFVIGGQVAPFFQSYVATVEAYDPATNTWTTKSPMPTARSGLVAAVVNGKIYAIGGYNLSQAGGAVTVEEYDPATNSWATKSSMPTSRGFCAASVLNGIIYVMGGYSGGQDVSTVEAYTPATDTWMTVAAMPTARHNLTASSVNGKIIAIGGYELTSISGYLNVVEQYDPLTNSWSTKSPMPVARENMASGVISGVIYVVGGDNIYPGSNTASAYDPATDTWTTKTSMPSAQVSTYVSSLAADVVYGKLYALGGLVTFEYTPSNDIL